MRALFLGLGSIGQRHLRNLTALAAERGISLHCDALRRGGRALPGDIANLVAKTYAPEDDIPRGYDVVFVTSPTAEHHADIGRFLPHTRHMFIEKPVYDAAHLEADPPPYGGGVYYVAAPLRYHPVLAAVRELLPQYRVLGARAQSSSYLPDWRPGTDYRQNYSARRAEGGGVAVDLVHEWDYLTSLFGFPREVFTIQRKVSSLEIDSDDVALYIADFGGMTAELHLDYYGAAPQRTLTLYCEGETIEADILGHRVKLLKAGKEIDLPREDIYQNEMNAFLDMIEGRRENPNAVRNAVRVLSLAAGRML